MNVAKSCSHIYPFPGETGSLLAAQEGGEKDGGRMGKVSHFVGLSSPPGLHFSLFSRRKEISLCLRPGTENIFSNVSMLIALVV